MPHRRAQARRRAGHDGRDRGAPRRLRSGSTAPSGDSLGRNDKALAGVELHESLAPALATLPRRERRILQLRFYGNQTQSQIATQLGISQMHESRLLARTLTRLREQLTD